MSLANIGLTIGTGERKGEAALPSAEATKGAHKGSEEAQHFRGDSEDTSVSGAEDWHKRRAEY